MAFPEVDMIQVQEILRRRQAGESEAAIARATGVSARAAGLWLRRAGCAVGPAWRGRREPGGLVASGCEAG